MPFQIDELVLITFHVQKIVNGAKDRYFDGEIYKMDGFNGFIQIYNKAKN